MCRSMLEGCRIQASCRKVHMAWSDQNPNRHCQLDSRESNNSPVLLEARTFLHHKSCKALLGSNHCHLSLANTETAAGCMARKKQRECRSQRTLLHRSRKASKNCHRCPLYQQRTERSSGCISQTMPGAHNIPAQCKNHMYLMCCCHCRWFQLHIRT